MLPKRGRTPLVEFNGRKRVLTDSSNPEAEIDFEVILSKRCPCDLCVDTFLWTVRYSDLKTLRYWHKTKLGKKLQKWIGAIKRAERCLKIVFVWGDDVGAYLSVSEAVSSFKADVELELVTHEDRYDKENIIFLTQCVVCNEIGCVGKQFMNMQMISMEGRYCKDCFENLTDLLRDNERWMW